MNYTFSGTNENATAYAESVLTAISGSLDLQVFARTRQNVLQVLPGSSKNVWNDWSAHHFLHALELLIGMLCLKFLKLGNVSSVQAKRHQHVLQVLLDTSKTDYVLRNMLLQFNDERE